MSASVQSNGNTVEPQKADPTPTYKVHDLSFLCRALCEVSMIGSRCCQIAITVAATPSESQHAVRLLTKQKLKHSEPKRPSSGSDQRSAHSRRGYAGALLFPLHLGNFLAFGCLCGFECCKLCHFALHFGLCFSLLLLLLQPRTMALLRQFTCCSGRLICTLETMAYCLPQRPQLQLRNDKLVSLRSTIHSMRDSFCVGTSNR